MIEIAIIFFILGLSLLFLGIIEILKSMERKEEGRIEGGGVIIVGPIPIVFGNVKLVLPLLIFATILILLLFIIIYH